MNNSGRGQVPELGTGMIYIPGSEPVLEACAQWIDVVEIEPQMFWSKTHAQFPRYQSNLDRLAWVRGLTKAKLLHGVGNPFGSSLSLDSEQLAAFLRIRRGFSAALGQRAPEFQPGHGWRPGILDWLLSPTPVKPQRRSGTLRKTLARFAWP